MKPEPVLSLIVPTRSSSTSLKQLLESISLQKVDFAFELLVVANPIPLSASLREKIAVLGRHFVCSSGVNRARQMGVSEAQGQWLYFLDDDCVLPSPQHLQTVFKIIQTASPHTVLGGPYSLKLPTTRWSQAYHIMQLRWLHEGQDNTNSDTHLLGGNLLIHQSAFKQAKFNESTEFGASETELLMELWQKGYKGQIYKDLEVVHSHRVSKQQFLNKVAMQGYGDERLKQRGLKPISYRHSLLYADQVERLQKEIHFYKDAFEFGRVLFLTSTNEFPKKGWYWRWLHFQRFKKNNRSYLASRATHPNYRLFEWFDEFTPVAYQPAPSTPQSSNQVPRLPLYAIGVIVRNDIKGLKRLLICLNRTLQEAESPWPIYISCNDVTADEFYQITALSKDFQFLNLTFIYSKEASLSQARQLILEACQTQWLAFLDTDCRVPRFWAHTLLEQHQTIREEPNCLAWGAPAIVKDTTLSSRVFKTAGQLFSGHHKITQPKTVRHIPSTHIILNVSKIREIGGFHRNFRSVGEDIYLSKLIYHRGGYLKLLPQPVVTHIQINTGKSFTLRMLRYGQAQGALLWYFPIHIFNIRIFPAFWLAGIVTCFMFSNYSIAGFVIIQALVYFALAHRMTIQERLTGAALFVLGTVAYGLGTFLGVVRRGT